MPKASRKDMEAARRLVRQRDGHLCQMCGLSIVDRPSAIHHRKPKQMGGSALLESASNLIRLCGSGNADGCHGRAHSNPQWARNHGWIVSRSLDPMEVPVEMHDGWFLLCPDGDRIAYTGEPA